LLCVQGLGIDKHTAANFASGLFCATMVAWTVRALTLGREGFCAAAANNAILNTSTGRGLKCMRGARVSRCLNGLWLFR
jgi:hypothetical protein